MTPTTFTRAQLNEAINEFADKITEALGATVTDEAETEPELAGTHFKVIDLDGEELVVDATDIACGTLVLDGLFEYFRCNAGMFGNIHPWMRYDGMGLTHKEFAAEMRDADTRPRIAHWG